MLRRIYRFLGIHILRYNVNRVLYKIFHYSFSIVYGRKRFDITFHNKKISVFSENYFSYINKPIPLRLIDGSYEKEEIKSIKKFLTKEMKVLELGGVIRGYISNN